MRTMISLVCLLLLSPAALADRAHTPTTQPPAAQAPAAQAPTTSPPTARPPAPVVQLAPIDLAAIPAQCKPLAKQAQAPNPAIAHPARISLASCMAERAIAPLSVCDCADSIVAIDAAAAPAIALLDDVIASAGPAIQAIAEDTEGRLYAGFAIRLRATLPAVGPGASEAEVTLHDVRAQGLEAQMAPWHEAAMAAFEHVVELARAHPEIARNAAAATAVRDAQQRVAAEVATR
ncbi:MAG TPA: hypothetical protein VFK02_32795 [Kofleriaceae bacterium]|nr:hypothetical protein [Kofleriaceae bacterium]